MLRLMQRVCWNTRGWQLPSGSTNERGFPGRNKFGHEEWNFQLADTWNGYVFPYTHRVPQKKILKDNEGIFSIGLFTRHQERNEWFFLGIYHNANLILEEEYSEIIDTFTKNGVFDRRVDELFSVTDKFANREAALEWVTDSFEEKYIKVKCMQSNVEVFPYPIQIDKPSNHRFKSFTYVGDFPLNQSSPINNRQQPSALAEDGYYRESSSKLKIIIPKHNKLSNDFCSWLKKNDVVAKQEENYIDILFKDKEVSYIAELKIVYGVGTTKSIREALGQLFEYNYYPGRKVNEEWMIVLDQSPVKSDFEYIDKLVKKIKIPLRVGWQTEEGFKFHPKWKSDL